jgi:hypothetical protein
MRSMAEKGAQAGSGVLSGAIKDAALEPDSELRVRENNRE